MSDQEELVLGVIKTWIVSTQIWLFMRRWHSYSSSVSNSSWWSIVECTQADSAYRHVACIHIIAPQNAFRAIADLSDDIINGTFVRLISFIFAWPRLVVAFFTVCDGSGRKWLVVFVVDYFFLQLSMSRCQRPLVCGNSVWNSFLVDGNGVQCLPGDAIRSNGEWEQFQIYASMAILSAVDVHRGGWSLYTIWLTQKRDFSWPWASWCHSYRCWAYFGRLSTLCRISAILDSSRRRSELCDVSAL